MYPPQPARRLASALIQLALLCLPVLGWSVDEADRSDSSPATQIIDRGKDFAVYRTVLSTTNLLGEVSIRTNQFTLIENNLSYLEDGQWKWSEDVIEPFPEGAIAQRGPDQAIFSPDLNAEAVFDILTSEGHRLRGGVRAIQLSDLATGQTLVLGTVKESAPGELLPPHRIAYRDAFEGLRADVLLDCCLGSPEHGAVNTLEGFIGGERHLQAYPSARFWSNRAATIFTLSALSIAGEIIQRRAWIRTTA